MNCKPGDMAVLVKAVLPANVGLIVQVVRAYGISVCAEDRGMFLWLIKPAWPCATMNTQTRIVKYGTNLFPVADAWLRPIRPPETPVTETRDEELTV